MSEVRGSPAVEQPLPLPPLPSRKLIVRRLPLVFPEGTSERNALTREISAKTIFAMFYVGAIEGRHRWLRPNQVTRMTDRQASRTSEDERERWIIASLSKAKSIAGRWFADNTREPIRDETIKNGLIAVGAVIEKPGLPVTSGLPRYALAEDFAALFSCEEAEFEDLLAAWREKHLTRAALARLLLVRKGVTAPRADAVEVTFPNGQRRHMSPGPSSWITKAVIEDFAVRFLKEPGVIWVSESRDKVVSSDHELAKAVGLSIDAQNVLPDIILVDLGGDHPLLVFVEVVASDGPMSERRRQSLVDLMTHGGHDPRNAAFVTALKDRGAPVYRKIASEVAWGTFVWFAAEPDNLIILHDTQRAAEHLIDLISR